MYFVIFITGILALLWFTFGSSLEFNYKSKKTKDIVSIASLILKDWNEGGLTTEKLDNTAYNNNMCILIQDADGYTVYSYDMMANNCLIHSTAGRQQLYKYRAAAAESSPGITACRLPFSSLAASSFCGFGVASSMTKAPTGASSTCSRLTSANHALPVASAP